MKIILTLSRKKKNDEIWEYITFSHNHPYILDPARDMYHYVDFFSHRLSIGRRGFDLKTFIRNRFTIINVFHYTENIEQPPLQESVTIKYHPVLTKKKCTVCFYRRQRKHTWCVMRGVKLSGDYWPRCEHWREHRWKKLGNDAKSEDNT